MANKPSGPDWEAYREAELKHHSKHGKGTGNYFEFDGQRWRLDNKGNGRYSPKSVDRKNSENKKVGGHREKMLAKQTASDVDPQAAEDARAKIRRAGKEHHHRNSRTRVEKGIQAKHGGEIPDHVRKQFADVGEYFGDDPRNYDALTPEEHRTGKNAVHKQYDQLDKLIKRSKGSFKGMRFPGGVRIQGIMNIFDYVGAIDEITGGHVDRTIKKGVSTLKNEVNYIGKSLMSGDKPYDLGLPPMRL